MTMIVVSDCYLYYLSVFPILFLSVFRHSKPWKIYRMNFLIFLNIRFSDILPVRLTLLRQIYCDSILSNQTSKRFIRYRIFF